MRQASTLLISFPPRSRTMRQRHPKSQKSDPQTLTRAVTHIRLEAVNAGKLAALDDLAQV